MRRNLHLNCFGLHSLKKNEVAKIWLYLFQLNYIFLLEGVNEFGIGVALLVHRQVHSVD